MASMKNIKSKFLLLSLSFSLVNFSFGRNVVSWIPVYGTSNCKALMNHGTKSNWLKNGLTHIGLQFWVPGDNGAVVFVTDYQFTYKAATIAQDVNDFVAWGNTNQVKTMLCLYNVRDDDFDWAYARNVFDDYPNETVGSIMTIVNTYNLDGVDIDFEGIGNFSSDKNAFAAFLDTLGKALHASGKELSVDIFSTPCYNAPNPSWESALAPHVDFMNLMGYNDTHENDNTLFQYCPQSPGENNSYPFRYSYIESYLTTKQGVASSKLNYGLPGWVNDWGGQCVHEHILDLADISAAGGIAIWDLQLSAVEFWQDPVTWELIAMFKNDSSAQKIRSALLICDGVVSIVESKAAVSSPVYYDSFHQVVHLSGMEGKLYLFSALGVAEKSWDVSAGEDISLEQEGQGFYILKFKTETGIFSAGVCLFK
jgi:hypothetical protein